VSVGLADAERMQGQRPSLLRSTGRLSEGEQRVLWAKREKGCLAGIWGQGVRRQYAAVHRGENNQTVMARVAGDWEDQVPPCGDDRTGGAAIRTDRWRCGERGRPLLHPGRPDRGDRQAASLPAACVENALRARRDRRPLLPRPYYPEERTIGWRSEREDEAAVGHIEVSLGPN